MAEFDSNQITDKLNLEFNSNERKIVFWYDENNEFSKDIEILELKNAKIHILKENGLFATKLLLEKKDTKSNYLVYAPFKRPSNRDNHLADTILYSTEFSADKTKLTMAELGIDKNHESVVKQHIRFFDAKVRVNRFLSYLVDNYTDDSIEITMMSALVKAKNSSFEEVVRILITDKEFAKGKYLDEFRKYNLEKSFWRLCAKEFDYLEDEPNLLKLIISLFATYTSKNIGKEIPSNLKNYVLNKPGTVITFLDQIMNNFIYKKQFDILSREVFRSIDGVEIFAKYEARNLINLDIFSFADDVIIKWIIARLIDENLNTMIEGKTIPEICKTRMKKHYGSKYKNEYKALSYAFEILSVVNSIISNNVLEIVKIYDSTYYKVDMNYRKFYYYLDKIGETTKYESLTTLVENIYVNKYLDPLDINFNQNFDYQVFEGVYKLQKDFYKNYVNNSKEKEVIIISDALRYEVAKELVERLTQNEKMDATIEPNIGIIPSITPLGMAALLPHKTLEIDELYNVKIDGKSCTNLLERQKILQSYDENAVCIQFDKIKKYKQPDLRKFVTGTSKIYIYHNQIDSRGDDAKTEDEVFVACEEAITEIIDLMKKLTNNNSITKYIITSDHGFIYKRNCISEAEKIDKFYQEGDYINRRFIISDREYEEQGNYSVNLKKSIGIVSDKVMTYPNTSNVLKMPGGGQNFFHGALSPQEVIIPVVRVKTVRGVVDTDTVKIKLLSIIPKITNLNTSLEFVQSDAISDVIKPTTYKIYFADKNGNAISNIQDLRANKKDEETAKRITKISFRFKDQKYSRDDEYFLIATYADSGMRLIEQKVVMDIIFSDEFELNV